MDPVGVGLRAVATLIDMIVLGIVGWAIAGATGATTPTGFNLVGGPAFLWFFTGLAYYVVLEANWGATLGKRAIGLRVVRLEGGGRIDWKASIIRNVLRVVDGLFFYLLGAIVVWASKKRQRLGDMAAGTIVVRAAKG
jgi:uncharacterized RDD family membrane protein YckC